MQHLRYSKTFFLAAIALAYFFSSYSAASKADYRSFQPSPSPDKPYYFEDGKVDFGTYNGFRRYHADCHVCHGPAGLGSSYAPALTESLRVMTWGDFVNVVISGRQGIDNRIMPAFAQNVDIVTNLSDIYAYLKARSDGVIGANRPKKFPKVKKMIADK
ncbi:MAG: c-type cytochrome [Candidatus Thiodiazotropha sp. LLP2]